MALELGKEIFGKVRIDRILFEVGYRYGGDLCHQGGFNRCLRIYEGIDPTNTVVSGHEYFGDDKFEVVNANIYVDDLVLTMSFPLLKESERYKPESINKSRILFIERTK